MIIPIIIFILASVQHSIAYESNITRDNVVMERTTFGAAIIEEEDAPYRIKLPSRSFFPVLYPKKLDASIKVDVGNITSDYELNIVIIIEMNITFSTENGYKGYILDFPVLNDTLLPNKEQKFISEEIDHLSGVQNQIENETFFPISSYYYLNMTHPNSSIDITFNLYLEQSNHNSTWNSLISLYTDYEYNADKAFYDFINNDPLQINTNDFKVAIQIPIFTSTLLLIYRKKSKY